MEILYSANRPTQIDFFKLEEMLSELLREDISKTRLQSSHDPG